MKPETPEVTPEVTATPPEYELDLSKLPQQTHNFVRRGIVISCEGAGHPNHRHFLVGSTTVTK